MEVESYTDRLYALGRAVETITEQPGPIFVARTKAGYELTRYAPAGNKNPMDVPPVARLEVVVRGGESGFVWLIREGYINLD